MQNLIRDCPFRAAIDCKMTKSFLVYEMLHHTRGNSQPSLSAIILRIWANIRIMEDFYPLRREAFAYRCTRQQIVDNRLIFVKPAMTRVQ